MIIDVDCFISEKKKKAAVVIYYMKTDCKKLDCKKSYKLISAALLVFQEFCLSFIVEITLNVHQFFQLIRDEHQIRGNAL